MGAYEKLPGQEQQMWGAFSVECPECGAPPGFACHKPQGKAPTTHTRPAESLRTLKPWPPPTRTPSSTHISAGLEYSSACKSIHNHKMETSATRREGP
jgi:hypothetical protein